MPQTKKSTLVLVAERAGVSIASVSRVMNGLPASDQVIARVRKAADELGYAPNATARSLKAGRTEQIALAVADVGNPVYVGMMHEVSRVVTKAGYRLVLSSTGSDPQDQIDLLTSLNRGFADGLILSPLRVSEELGAKLAESRLPIVIIGSVPPGVELDNVRADSATGMALAVERLVAQGRERIALVNGPVDTVPGAARLGGYLRALEQHGLPANPEAQIAAKDFTYSAGLKAAVRLLEQSTPDAVVCANDLLAIAVQKVVQSRGLSVPEDIAIVGMDDTELADLANPSITSVDLGSVKRAKTAARLLLRRLDDPQAAVEQVVIEPSLTVRASSARGVQEVDVTAVVSPADAVAPTPATTGGPTPTGRKRKRNRGYAGSGRDAWLLVLPALIPVLAFSVYPLVQGILLGFTDAKAGLNQVVTFNGVDNYVELLGNELFWNSFRIGLIWAFGVTILQFLASLGLALLLNLDLKLRWLARTLALVPWAMPPVIIAIMWRLMLNPTYGPINGAMKAVGLPGDINWLGDFSTALPAVIVVGIWAGMPQTTITLLAGLQGVSADLHEAAAIDGANTWQRFWHITLPALRPVIVAITTLDLIWNFNSFALVYVLTAGGPGGQTMLPMLFAYNEAFRYGNFGYAAAMGNVMVVVIAAFLFFYLRSQARSRLS